MHEKSNGNSPSFSKLPNEKPLRKRRKGGEIILNGKLRRRIN
jgi:hypothetical protein